MSKFLKTMIVLLTIAAMATPVLAEDMLSLGGQMRVRGAYLDNALVDPSSADGDDMVQRDGSVFNLDQRLRIGGLISVADGVSITFRTDFSEGKWGNDNGFGRFGSISAMDRAHIDLDGDMFHLRIGTQNNFWGNAVDVQETGALFTIKGAMPIDVLYILEDDNESPNVVDPSSDGHIYGARVRHSNDNYAGSLFFAGFNDGEETSVNVFSATLDYNMDAINIAAELDFFTGDHDQAGNIDAMGTQGFVDISMAASEAMNVGGALYYALGADTDGTEQQYTFLGNNFNVWDPLNRGAMQNYNLQLAKRPYDFFGIENDAGSVGAGVMALQGYVDYQASDALGFSGSLAYAEPEEEDNTTIDSALIFNVSTVYQLMANTSILGQLQYADLDVEAGDADELMSVGTALVVNF